LNNDDLIKVRNELKFLSEKNPNITNQLMVISIEKYLENKELKINDLIKGK